jgi:chorismate synthase
MSGNSFGKLFKITTFGESHGVGIGVIIDGCPAGLAIDAKYIQAALNKRKPGQSTITTARNESDTVIIQSGVFEGKTTGTPISLFIANQDAHSADYDALKNIYRPSHADFTYQEKYGHRDYRGGGRSSARETANWVAAGAVAKRLLSHYKIDIQAFVTRVYDVQLTKDIFSLDLNTKENNIVRCPDEETAQKMIQKIEAAKAAGDSLGGVITCIVKNCPTGLGEPVFDKLEAALAKAMLSINAVKGFEIGSGFEAAKMKGSEHNDIFKMENEKVTTITNYSGGIQGGISNGMPIYFNVAFKPVATLLQNQNTLNTANENKSFKAQGRHDPCVVPRAVPIVEAMTALVLADNILINKTVKL